MLTDALTGSLLRTLNEGLTLGEALARTIARTVAEAFVAGENLDIVILRATAMAEALSLSETETRQVQRSITKSLTSAAMLAPLVTRSTLGEAAPPAVVRTVAESLAPGELLATHGAAPAAGKRSKQFATWSGLAVLGALAVWFAHAGITSNTSAGPNPLPLSLPATAAPLETPARGAVTAPGPAAAPEGGAVSRAIDATPIEHVVAAPRPRALAASEPPPRQTRAAGEDPGAIIDWLLSAVGPSSPSSR